MEYLVTMTTQVPEGTSEQDVDAMRAREAEHTRELAAQGRVLRLWRPPLAPGEWRTIGLFAADDAEDLERTLASMPLHVWRTDEPVPLGVHGNDPGPGTVATLPDEHEYLVIFTLQPPDDADTAAVERMNADEADRARELADQGNLIRLWTMPRKGRNISLWQAPDPDTMDAVLWSLPMAAARWVTVETVPLTRHPSDPGV